MLDRNLVSEVLDVARSGGATFAELFMEDTVTTNLHLLGGNVKDAGGGNLYGAGLRLFYGTKVVYAYTNDCTADGLMEVARTMARAQGSGGEVDARGVG